MVDIAPGVVTTNRPPATPALAKALTEEEATAPREDNTSSPSLTEAVNKIIAEGEEKEKLERRAEQLYQLSLEIEEAQIQQARATREREEAALEKAALIQTRDLQESGVTGVERGASGGEVDADQFGRPHVYRRKNGQEISSIFGGVERDYYGPGVHADAFGGAVYDSQPDP